MDLFATIGLVFIVVIFIILLVTMIICILCDDGDDSDCGSGLTTSSTVSMMVATGLI